MIYDGVDPTTGKERRQWHPGGPVKRDAERLVNELVKRKDDGTYRGPDRLTLGEYLTERWLPGQVSQLSPATFDSYRRNIELHVVPRLGAVPPQKLAAEDLDGLYASLSTAGGRRDGKKGGLSPKSVRIVHAVLHKALSDARRKGTIARTWPRWPTHRSCGPLRNVQRSTFGLPKSSGGSWTSPLTIGTTRHGS